MKRQINLDSLYTEPGQFSYYKNGFNSLAFVVTIVAVIVSLSGKFIPVLEPVSRLSWFVGVIVAFGAYALFASLHRKKNPSFYDENTEVHIKNIGVEGNEL